MVCMPKHGRCLCFYGIALSGLALRTKSLQFNNPKGKNGKELKLQCSDMPYGRGLNFTAGQTC